MTCRKGIELPMQHNRQRVFVYASLMRNLQNLDKLEVEEFLGRVNKPPLYVMLHAKLSEHDLETGMLGRTDTSELYELDDEDLDLIRQLESHPEFFRRTTIQLDDGTEAVAYDLANPRLYTMHRVIDENDWLTVMDTYDPTWMVGPSVPKKRRRR